MLQLRSALTTEACVYLVVTAAECEGTEAGIQLYWQTVCLIWRQLPLELLRTVGHFFVVFYYSDQRWANFAIFAIQGPRGTSLVGHIQEKTEFIK